MRFDLSTTIFDLIIPAILAFLIGSEHGAPIGILIWYTLWMLSEIRYAVNKGNEYRRRATYRR